MDALLRDLRFAGRTLARAPGFTLVAVATLALGIGTNTAVFSVVDAVLLRPLPFYEPSRLVAVWRDASAWGGSTREPLDPGGLSELGDEPGLFEAVGGWAAWSPTLTELGDAEVLPAARVTAGTFEGVLRVEPILGRGFLAEEDLPGAAGTVLLSHGFWLERFGGDRSALGRPIILDEEPYVVIGVMPEGFAAPFAPEATVWAAARLDPGHCAADCLGVGVMGRLAEGTSFEVARERTSALAARWSAVVESGGGSGGRAELLRLREDLVGDTAHALWMLLGAVGGVLLIACTNVAVLLLVRGATRRAEFGVREAMGADRASLLRQLLVEGLLLAALGGVAGIALASWSVEGMLRLLPISLPPLTHVGVQGRVLAFTAVLVLGTGLAFGMVPAVRAGDRDLGASLRRRRGAARFEAALVVGQVSLTMVLLVGSGLLVRSLQRLHDTELGLEPTPVLTVEVAVPPDRFTEQVPRTALLEALLERLGGMGSIRSVAAASFVPLVTDGLATELRFEDAVGDARTDDLVRVRPVMGGYFYTIGQRVVAGREFEARDAADGPPVAIVTERLAARLLGDPNRDPIGMRVALGPGPPVWRTIVGVVSDTRHLGPRDTQRDAVYVPFPQLPTRTATFLVRTDGDPTELGAEVRAALADVDPGLAASSMTVLGERAEGNLSSERLATRVLTTFSVLALLLTAVGLYGVVSLTVSRRVRELGIRIALGADGEHVRRLVLRGSLRIAIVGIALGAAGALALGRLLRALLYEVPVMDAPTFAGTTAILAAVALFASRPPAERAIHTDPVHVMRER